MTAFLTTSNFAVYHQRSHQAKKCAIDSMILPRNKVQATSCRPRSQILMASNIQDEKLQELYSELDKNWLNRLLLSRFRSKLSEQVGYDSEQVGYPGVIDIVLYLARREWQNPITVQETSVRVLDSLFPGTWIFPLFRRFFSTPFPTFSNKMNAHITRIATQWLMGESIVDEDGVTVLVTRCRYLEETSCVGTCVNSCKRPTQEFFASRLGINVHLDPNYVRIYTN
mmetsp:Transcript_3489/g.6109  ORF Transcript_3489/g.6109 Transcript_3489/m.6109 type:complete len:226 (-) Transcript_3489:356-1033(-)